ncbi:MAG: cytochrome P450 [Isosphaerales bacterium]
MEAIKFEQLFQLGIADPFPFYHRLRASDPVYWCPDVLPGWYISRHADVLAITEDGKRFGNKDIVTYPLQQETNGTFWHSQADGILFRDGADHARVRRLCSMALSEDLVQGMRPRTEALANQLLDGLRGNEAMDVVNDYAVPLSHTILLELVGAPPRDVKLLRRWGIDLHNGLDLLPNPETARQGEVTNRELVDYYRQAIAERRRNPARDLISGMIAAESEGAKLTEAEMIGTLIQMTPGPDAVTMLMSNAVLALIRHSDQLQLLRQNPSLMPNAIQEFLRYEAPVGVFMRVATEDVSFRDQPIKKGQMICLMFRAANRDPERFADPDRLDVTREQIIHFSFSQGPHRCMGYHLAPLIAEIGINALVQRLSDLTLATDKLVYRKSFVMRALEALPVTFSAR